MKTRKILDRIQAFLDADRRAQIKEAAAVKDVLEKLKKKEKHLLEKIAESQDTEERDKLERKRAVCHAQRKKGLGVLKELQEAP